MISKIIAPKPGEEFYLYLTIGIVALVVYNIYIHFSKSDKNGNRAL
jgi:hypothetical protein